MTERKDIPGSAASHPTDKDLSAGILACGQWETLLADALDGLLKPEDEAAFMAHIADCPACAALHEEARKGREWLEFLSPEPEAPAGLLEEILAHTGPGHAASGEWVGGAMPAAAETAAVPAFVPPVRHPSDQDPSLGAPVFHPSDQDPSLGAPVWQQPGFFAWMLSSVQPRLLMTAAMAFFSIALTLNMTGVRLADIHLTGLRLADLRPQAVRSYMERQLTTASVPIVRYYDHLRFVDEVESRVRELRGQSEGNDNERKETQPATPGETRRNPEQNPGAREGKSRENLPQQSGSPEAAPASDEAGGVLEGSLTWCDRDSFYKACTPTAVPSTAVAAATPAQDDTIRFSAGFRSEGAVFQGDCARSGDSFQLRVGERGKVWIA